MPPCCLPVRLRAVPASLTRWTRDHWVVLHRVRINTFTHGPWADQPTDFILPKTQNSLKFKNLKKICNPSLVSYKQLLLQKI